MHISSMDALNTFNMSKKKEKEVFVCQNLVTNDVAVVMTKTGLSQCIGVHRNTINSIIESNNESILIYKEYRIWKQIKIMN